MPDVDWNDVQGLVLRGYRDLPAAAFLLLRVRDDASGAASRWLRDLAAGGHITSGEGEPETPEPTCLNVAFTRTGLAAFGVNGGVLGEFSDPFLEGLTEERRRDILGDTETGGVKWEWGGPDNPDTHVLLALFAKNPRELEQLVRSQRESYGVHGLEEIGYLDRVLSLPQGKEHFGFRDGLSQPAIRGQRTKNRREEDTLAAGEFLLGHANEAGRLPGKAGLPAIIGHNGSYLVFLQLDQDVRAFWKFVDEHTANEGEQRLIASKMVGRDPDGTPLVSGGKGNNDFGFSRNDPDGLQCPVGAHIRRANPRDMFDPHITKRHRIIRRGRAYGPPIVASMEVEDILNEVRRDSPSEKRRGLYFLCLNADIVEQFEFIQRTWLNSPHFGELYDEVDPVVGDQSLTTEPQFTVPEDPLPRRLTGLRRFVKVRGGGYFFLPGIAAIKYVASLRADV